MRQEVSREPRRPTFTAGAYPAITPQRLAAAAALQRPPRPRWGLPPLRGPVRWLTATTLALALALGFTLQRTWSARARERTLAAVRAQDDSIALAATRDSLRMAREELAATTRAVARAVSVWDGSAQPRRGTRGAPGGPLSLRREAAAYSGSVTPRSRATPRARAGARPPTPRPPGA